MADKPEFLEAFLKYEANLRAFVAAMVRNRQDCEDVFQETALTLWHKYGEYDPSRPFGAWAKGVAAKKVLQCRTKSGRIPTPFSPATINALVDAFERSESRRPEASVALEMLDECAKTLPSRSRTILSLRYREGCTMAQIAERLASTTAAVTMAFSRIRASLHECVRRRLRHLKEPVE